MMKKLLILFFTIYGISSANAQWHFSITSMNYNDNCSGNAIIVQAMIEVEMRKTIVNDAAAKNYSTKEECERGRSTATMNWSSGGCYIRTTTSPCTGGNIGGGGTQGSGIGENTQGGLSLFNSTAIGEPYFAPNEAYAVSSMGQDLEIKLEVLNKSFNDAIGGIKTGDKDFDDIYNRQVGQMPKVKDSNPYRIVPRREIDPEKPIYVDNLNDLEQVNLEKDNNYDFGDNAIIPNVENTASSFEIEWNEGLGKNADNNDNKQDKPLYVIIPEAPELIDPLFPNANIENVQRYCDNSEPLADIFLRNPNKLEYYLETQFDSVSGFNLKEIRDKLPKDRTEEEKQALFDYESYRVKEMEQMNKDIEKYIDNSKEKKEIDAAILALDSYGDDKEGWLSQTNFKKLDLESLSNVGEFNEHQSILSLAEKINESNKTQSETGFHAELYYNEATDAYVISFRGTEGKDLNDIKTDVKIGSNAVLRTDNEIKQYEIAMEIAEVINNIYKEDGGKLNIEVVGHSLGGGLASIVGLETGIDAKTYNAAMVPDNFLKEKGLYDKVNNGDVQNITAYRTSTDLLTNSQKKIDASAIGIPIDIGNPATLLEGTTAKVAGAAAGPIAGVVAGVAAGGVVGAAAGDVIGTAVGNVVGETAGNVVGTIGTGAGAVAGAIVGGTAGVVVGAAEGATLGSMVQGHRMPPITRHFFKSNTEKKKTEWDYIHNAQDQLQKELRNAESKQLLKRNY